MENYAGWNKPCHSNFTLITHREKHPVLLPFSPRHGTLGWTILNLLTQNKLPLTVTQ